MGGTVTVDAFTLFEYMARNAKTRDDKLVYSDGALKAAHDTGLKYKDPRKMAEYTKSLKDAGLLKYKSREWIINLDQAKHSFVQGMDAPVSELIMLTPNQEKEEVNLEEAVDKVSNEQLATAIARELFNRLSVAQHEAREAFNNAVTKTKHEVQVDHTAEVEKLKKQIADQEAGRMVAEKYAQVYKEKANRLELQVAHLMRSLSNSDSDDLRAMARDFFRSNSNVGASVSIGSQKPSGEISPKSDSQSIQMAPGKNEEQKVNRPR